MSAPAPCLQVEVGDSATSVTRTCQLFSGPREEGGLAWVDTVGYDDTAGLEDEETFKNVLRFMAEHKLQRVAAVVWTVLPQVWSPPLLSCLPRRGGTPGCSARQSSSTSSVPAAGSGIMSSS